MGSSPNDIIKEISERVKARRLELNLTQRALSKRSGVGYDAYRRFEKSGEITLRNLVLCAIALGDVESFKDLFSKRAYQSIDDILNEQTEQKRKRGSKNE